MIRATSRGSFNKTTKALNAMASGKPFKDLDKFGRQGVDALSRATPLETGETKDSWGYQTNYSKSRYSLSWFNTHEVDGVIIAVILQYGHATGSGAWIDGIDYINPAAGRIMDKAIEDAWRQVRNA